MAGAVKKRKISDEGRVFNDDWSRNYFVIPHERGAMCVICETPVAVMKEYNIKRHYTSKHASMYDSLTGQSRLDKLQVLIDSLKKQRNVFQKYKNGNEVATKLSFKIAEQLQKEGNRLVMEIL